jgi:hypothetical protein
MDSPQLYTTQIQDLYVRKNFQALVDYFSNQNQLLDFKFIEQDFTAAVSKVQVKHGLKVTPRDLVRMEVSGPGVVTFHRGLFDSTYLYISTTDAVHVRFLVGLYKGQAGSNSLAADVTEQWKAAV